VAFAFGGSPNDVFRTQDEATRANPSYAMINDFLIDATITENHEYSSEVTKYPVESGSTFTDNIRNEPLVVTMECIISNTPVGKITLERVENPVQDIYARLLKIRADRTPVTIRTSLSTFTSMALEKLSIPRSKGGGDHLHFTAQFMQIEVVTVDRTERAFVRSTGGLVNRGSVLIAYRVDVSRKTWFDPDISAYRKDAILPKIRVGRFFNSGTGGSEILPQHDNGLTKVDDGLKLRWQLNKGRPVQITRDRWRALTDAQRKDDVFLRKLTQAEDIKFLGTTSLKFPLRPEERVLAPDDFFVTRIPSLD
jgi:hypothetical protein